MQVFRNNPLLAVALLVVALIVLGVSLYFSFGRRATSPFEGTPAATPSQPAPATQPQPQQDRDAATIL
ncbi:MAG: hypothetical protein RMJ83_00225 [Armatimonadota bacterium]|nr:hypothetical protein [Armatimonadota bacterium]